MSRSEDAVMTSPGRILVSLLVFLLLGAAWVRDAGISTPWGQLRIDVWGDTPGIYLDEEEGR